MTKISPLVSVTVPAYNAERVIGTMIDSVLAQTYIDFELIICDDASSDNTVSIIDSYADERIRLIRNDRNLGEGATRDRAILAARGKFIAVLDADDAWIPYRLEKLVRAAEVHPGDIIFDEIMECHDTPNGMIPWRNVRHHDAFGDGDGDIRMVTFSRFITCKRTLIKPLIPLQLIRTYNVVHSKKRFSADLEFFLALLSHGSRLWYVPFPMYLYRLSASGMSATPERYELLLQTLEAATDKFDHDPEAMRALQKKIRAIQHSRTYQPFFSALVSGSLATATRVALRHPWVIPEFIRRSLERIPYHLHRFFHHGDRRDTT